jgi:hypothetical protein
MKMTKLKVLLISLAGGVLCLLLAGERKMLVFWCGVGGVDCQNKLAYFSDFLILFLPIFLFSLVTYFIKEEVFKAWLKFTYWYFPVYILSILFLSGMGGGGGYMIGNVFDSNFFAISLSGLYIIISLILVVYKAVSLKGSKK